LAFRIFCPDTLKDIRVPPVEELLELDDDEELDELLDELELLLEDELELEELLDEELELEELELVRPLIEPADAVSVTRSIRAPSSRRTIRSVCVPAARLLNIARLRVE
jgi:hypothetical protein